MQIYLIEGKDIRMLIDFCIILQFFWHNCLTDLNRNFFDADDSFLGGLDSQKFPIVMKLPFISDLLEFVVHIVIVND